MDAMRAQTFLAVPKVIEEATADFNRIFGRNYDPFVEQYKLEDAEIAFFIMGAHANTCRTSVDSLRKKGVKAGMARLRWVRPWPTHQLAEALGHVKAVGVVETSTSYGGAMRGGNLIHELRASLYDLDQTAAGHLLHGRPRRRDHLARRFRLHGEGPHAGGTRRRRSGITSSGLGCKKNTTHYTIKEEPCKHLTISFNSLNH